MKFKDFFGREVIVQLNPKDYPVRSLEECRSKLQFVCGQKLREIFPRLLILEEFTIPGSKMKLDFFIPSLMMAFEVHGQQHFKYNPFFFASRQDFAAALKRDQQKANWCEQNDIKLIILEKEQDVLAATKQQLLT